MKKILIIVISLAAIACLLFAADSCVKRQFDRSVDNATGTVQISGIGSRVTIRRDALGVPYIEANNEDDLFFAAGYAAASDRLWQMTMMKMVMQGRMSEILGEDGMQIDLFMRTLGARAVIEGAMKKMDARSLRVLESYSRGVNAYIESHADLPAEFFLTRYRPEPWKQADSLYVFAALTLSLSSNFIEELDFLNLSGRVGYEKAAWLMPIYPDEDLPFGEAGKLAGVDPRGLNTLAAGWSGVRDGLSGIMPLSLPASNNWALSGMKTKSGRPIVCNDTHLEDLMPNAWVVMHLKCPTYEAAGVTAPGIPIIALGYNGRVAWGATMVMADNQDIFIEKLKVIDGKTCYQYRGQWVPVQVRREKFSVRGGKDIHKDILSTIHGPLLNEALAAMPFPPLMPVQPLPVKSEYGFAISWGLGSGERDFNGFLSLGSVRSAAELRPAVMGVESIFLNVVYGDAGSIGWQVTGKFPLRKKGTGQLPSPGWTGEYDWTGYLPMAMNPHSENPASGTIVTANNRTVDRGYPYHLSSSWERPERAERITQVLGPMKGATVEDMMRLQFDHYSLFAKKIQDMLCLGDPARNIRNVIMGWDGRRRGRALEALNRLDPKKFNAVMDRDSANAAVMGAFIHCASRETFLDELGPDSGMLWEALKFESFAGYSPQQDHILGRENSPFWDNVTTGRKETKWDIIAESLQKSILLCEERMGYAREQWRWGRLHAYMWTHDFTKQLPVFHGYFNRGPYPASGDGNTVNVTSFMVGENFDVSLIPAMRLVVDFGLAEPAMLVGVPGQSGNPSSGHYDTMLDYWLNGRNHPLPFGADAVKAQYRDALVLEPK